MNSISNPAVRDSDWQSLYRVGGLAGLLAAIIFRRNLGVEISLFSAQQPPAAVEDWFALLQANRLLGLAYLHVFDLVNYALLALLFLALYASLRRIHQSAAAIALALGFLGIATYFASNTAFSLLSLSDQYALAASPAEQAPLLAAGQALLALNRFSSAGAHPGSGGYLSLLLIAVAGLLFSVTMLKSAAFRRAAAVIGLLAHALDLAYCIAFAFLPAADAELLSVLFIPAAGLFLMVWHLMVGWRLYRLGSLDRTRRSPLSARGFEASPE